MADETEAGDDVGWWDCSLCTYRNSADKFKCEICDLRRGTSTRKPRCNADTIVAQVVKQQEQIRQQTRAKPSPKIRGSTTTSTNNSLAATSSNDSANKAKKNPNHSLQTASSDSSQSITSSPKPKRKKLLHKTSKSSRRKNTNANNNNTNEIDDDTESSQSDSSEATDELSRASSPQMNGSDSESYLEGAHCYSPVSPSEATTSSPNNSLKTKENPFKITPLEISGNLIKYSPPTTSGRTGLIIDKKRFTQHSVTVNDVTITFTEFATRQNKYIRKKKKRRDDSRSGGNGNNGKNGRTLPSKSEPKSSNNNAPAAATGDS